MSGFWASPYSYNGVQINDGTNYSAYFETPEGTSQQKAAPVEVNRHYAPPVLVDKQLKPLLFRLHIVMNGSFPAQKETLQGLFDTRDRTEHALIIQNTADSNKQYQRLCTVEETLVALPEYIVTLRAEDPVWASVTQNSDTWAITATGQTHTIDIGGNVATQPVFDIKPTAAKTGGFGYKEFVIAYNPGTLAMPNRGYEITGGWDTATEVTAGRMLASGNDLRVYVDAIETNRWLSGTNGASTKVWIALSFAPKIEATVAAMGIADTSLSFQLTTANMAAWKALPSAGSALIDTEVISWTGKTGPTGAATTGGGTLTGLTRGARNTAPATHSAGATLRWLEHDIQIVHGNASLGAPTTDDTLKPIFDLTGGDTSWVYGTNFNTLAGKRPGEWKCGLTGSVAMPSLRTSRVYTAPISGTVIQDADPATAIGMHLASWPYGNIWKQEAGGITATLYDPAGFTAINPSGNTYRDTGVTWPLATIEKSNDGRNWTNVLTVSSPATGLHAWAPGNQTLGATYKWLRFRFQTATGGIAAGAGANGTGNEADWEVTSITLTLASGTIPQLTFGARQGAYELQCVLTNTDSGEALGLHYTMPLNTTLRVDCAAQAVTFLGDNTSAFGALSKSSVRQHWLDCAGGATLHLKFDDVGTNGVTVTTKWNDREN